MDIMVKQTQIFGLDINSIQISDIVINLNKSAHFVVAIYGTDGDLVHSRSIALDGDEYDSWGDDDNYIVEITLKKLGLEKA